MKFVSCHECNDPHISICGQVRDYTAKLNETPEMAAQKGMDEMSEKFREMGSSIYLKS